jgi:hypothetical protein
MLDDYDAALRPNEAYTEADMLAFLLDFRNLAVHSKEAPSLSTIVTSFRRLNELGPKLTPSGSPWYNHYLFRPLMPFRDDEVTALLDRMPLRWTLTPQQQGGVRELANGHPALLQNACHLLYNSWRDGQTPDVETFARDFESSTEQFFRDTWTFSAETEQMLMTLIALSHLEGRLSEKRRYDLSGVEGIFSQMERELRDLEERGVIQRTTEQGKDVYSFASSIMEWWVIREIENSANEEELAQRQKVFHNLSRRQVEQIKRVMQQVWQYKDAAVSLAGWVGKLAGAFSKGFAGGKTPA